MSAPHLIDLYHYSVGWCEGPACYIAACAEFQGLTVQGDEPKRALATLKTAIQDIVDGLHENAEPIPEPMIAPDVTDNGPFNDCT
jgi:predicted RNase H-like HicB family nuclease